jgi:hypothetical protein
MRISHPELSLWQSAVAEVVADRHAGGDVASPVVQDDPRVQQAGSQALDVRPGDGLEVHPRFARILALARHVHLGGVAARTEAMLEAAGTYTTDDPGFFVECVARFIEYYGLGRQPRYRDWLKDGGGDPNFGVVPRPLPPDARIAVIGDWGTGLPDARAMLEALVAELRPAALIHVGDVYYSGTERESRRHFRDVLADTFGKFPPPIPVYDLPGNHDYYAGGRAFYDTIDTLNAGAARQPASYFCVRSADDRWQLVGMDTGFHDRVPGMKFDPLYRAPHLHDSERDWVRHTVSSFTGRTLLFSHHPLFSARLRLNGSRSGRSKPNVNDYLLDTVAPIADRIALWLWGHEHLLAIYQEGLHGIQRCRLVGCSGFETPGGEGPVPPLFTDAPERVPLVELSVSGGRTFHGFALIDLGTAAVGYYEFPSWSGATPESPPGPPRLLFQEPLTSG